MIGISGRASIKFCDDPNLLKILFHKCFVSHFLVSLFSYLTSEVTRGYVLDHDEERYTTRRQKMYTFMKIPRELEKFMSYGFFHCLVRSRTN